MFYWRIQGTYKPFKNFKNISQRFNILEMYSSLKKKLKFWIFLNIVDFFDASLQPNLTPWYLTTIHHNREAIIFHRFPFVQQQCDHRHPGCCRHPDDLLWLHAPHVRKRSKTMRGMTGWYILRGIALPPCFATHRIYFFFFGI